MSIALDAIAEIVSRLRMGLGTGQFADALDVVTYPMIDPEQLPSVQVLSSSETAEAGTTPSTAMAVRLVTVGVFFAPPDDRTEEQSTLEGWLFSIKGLVLTKRSTKLTEAGASIEYAGARFSSSTTSRELMLVEVDFTLKYFLRLESF